MKNGFLRKLAKSQKYQILSEIKRSQGLSVAELCDRVKLSYMGVKQHCVALEKEGYLDTWRRPKGMGRPEKAYRLTGSAQELFPTDYTDLTSEILRSIGLVYGPAAPEKILFQIYNHEIETLQSKIKGDVLEDKARALVEYREAKGYMAEYYFNPDLQIPQIIEYNSPVLQILDTYSIVKDLEKQLFENVLGTQVIRQEERVSGLYKCTFHLNG
jgi:predicted ArsR family transcriptional regulator